MCQVLHILSSYLTIEAGTVVIPMYRGGFETLSPLSEVTRLSEVAELGVRSPAA